MDSTPDRQRPQANQAHGRAGIVGWLNRKVAGLIAARSRAGLTQGEVAERMGTTQSVVARLESGRRTPSMRTVQRYAQAVGARAVVHLETVAA